jgi:hypothetical protein
LQIDLFKRLPEDKGASDSFIKKFEEDCSSYSFINIKKSRSKHRVRRDAWVVSAIGHLGQTQPNAGHLALVHSRRGHLGMCSRVGLFSSYVRPNDIGFRIGSLLLGIKNDLLRFHIVK